MHHPVQGSQAATSRVHPLQCFFLSCNAGSVSDPCQACPTQNDSRTTMVAWYKLNTLKGLQSSKYVCPNTMHTAGQCFRH